MDFLSQGAIARATLLSERLAAASDTTSHESATAPGHATGHIPAGGLVEDPADAIAGWTRRLGGAAALARRLTWSGLDAGAAGAIARSESVTGDWPVLLHELREAVAASPPIAAPASGDVPFLELLRPMAEHAAARLPVSPLITQEAWQPSVDWLMRRLARMAAPTLLHLFDQERPPLDPLERVLRWDGAVPAPATAYVAFVERHRADGLGTVFEAYPTLARLIATVTADWLSAARTLASRLESDHDGIATALLAGGAPRVIEARCGLSDPHRGGSTVWSLAFEGGTVIIYKPRSVALERAWSALVRWCESSGMRPVLRAPAVVVGDGYGWMEFVRAAPAVDAAARGRLAERAGALLCLVHLLRGTDCHSDNVIADGEHPALVDAETLLHPDPHAEAHADYDARLHDNVARTGFLPRWEWHERAGRALLSSGLGMFGPPRPAPVGQWEAIGTDWLRRRRLDAGDSEPLADAVDSDALARGFAAAYRHVLAHRAAMPGVLEPFNGQPVRYVYRPTQVYDVALGHATGPASLRDGLRFGAALDALRSPFLGLDARPDVWPMLDEELSSLETGDAPYFESRTDSVALRTSHGAVVARGFDRPSFTRVIDGLERLSEQDLAFQLTVIRGTLAASRTPAATAVSPSSLTSSRGQAPAATADLPPADAALAIGRRIVSDALLDHRGHARWMGLAAVPPTARLQYAVLGDGLYDGNAGIALFLAALDAHLGGRSEYAAAAARALAHVRDAVHHQAIRSIGATGGVVYALTRVSQLLGDPAWLDVARDAARQITHERIAVETRYDVMFGSAGAVLGLLTLHRETGDPDALNRALQCGRRLLAGRQLSTRAWLTISHEPIAGFSHGQAGIGLALLRLAHASGDEDFARAGLDAFAYEDQLFDTKRRTWPPHRVAWCHGAPGIALARLAAPERWRDALVTSRASTAAALLTTKDSEAAATDHLCCGTLGRSDILLHAARVLQDPALAQAATSMTKGVVARANDRGGYAIHPGLSAGSAHPGLYQGTAGIGYHLLRLANPSLPSVLAWD